MKPWLSLAGTVLGITLFVVLMRQTYEMGEALNGQD